MIAKKKNSEKKLEGIAKETNLEGIIKTLSSEHCHSFIGIVDESDVFIAADTNVHDLCLMLKHGAQRSDAFAIAILKAAAAIELRQKIKGMHLGEEDNK